MRERGTVNVSPVNGLGRRHGLGAFAMVLIHVFQPGK